MSGTTTAARARLPRAVLRVHRTALIVWGAFVTGLIGWLVWLNAITMDSVRAAEAACSRGPWTCVDLIEALRYSEPMPMRRALPALTVSVAAMWLLNLVPERFRPALWPTVTRSSPQRFELPNSVWQQEWGRTAGGGHYASYHPACHFRPLHLVETGTVPAVAVLATAAAFAALRRRTV